MGTESSKECNVKNSEINENVNMLKQSLVNSVNVNDSSEKLIVYDSFELSSSEIELF